MRFLTGCESIPAAGIEGGQITVSFNLDGTIFSSTCLHQLELPVLTSIRKKENIESPRYDVNNSSLATILSLSFSYS